MYVKDKMKSKIINISIPETLLSLAGEQATKESRSRSELFREALRSYLVTRSGLADLYDYSKERAGKANIAQKDLAKTISRYRDESRS